MAKVLKSKGKYTHTLQLPEFGAGYQFPGEGGSIGNVCLVMNDMHADLLLERYPEQLTLVKEKDYFQVYRDKIKAIEARQVEKLRELNPSLFDKMTKKVKSAVSLTASEKKEAAKEAEGAK